MIREALKRFVHLITFFCLVFDGGVHMDGLDLHTLNCFKYPRIGMQCLHDRAALVGGSGVYG